MKRSKWLLIIALFWLVVIGGFIGYKQYTITTGTEVLLRMRPVDPRDVFRGDYMTINYEISDLGGIPRGNETALQAGETAFTTLSLTAEKVATATQVARVRPPAGVLYLRGTVNEWKQIVYGIESYFIPEKTGSDLSRKLWKDPAHTYVRVSVDKEGRGIVRGFVVNGVNVELGDLQARTW